MSQWIWRIPILQIPKSNPGSRFMSVSVVHGGFLPHPPWTHFRRWCSMQDRSHWMSWMLHIVCWSVTMLRICQNSEEGTWPWSSTKGSGDCASSGSWWITPLNSLLGSVGALKVTPQGLYSLTRTSYNKSEAYICRFKRLMIQEA